MMKFLIKYSVLLGGLLLLSCSTPDATLTEPVVDNLPQPGGEQVIVEPVVTEPDPFLRARILADILYAARLAFEDNQLMSPADDNAYDRYLEVLSLDPGNAVAVAGLEEIVLRYVELADQALRIGKYDNAESMLNRAASIRPGSNDIAEALQRLTEARKTEIDFFELDSNELKQQSTLMLVRISEIAEHVKQSEATFLITARTDLEGRWIYKIMRESVGGYRLRGNIELGLEPGIQVNVPRS